MLIINSLINLHYVCYMQMFVFLDIDGVLNSDAFRLSLHWSEYLPMQERGYFPRIAFLLFRTGSYGRGTSGSVGQWVGRREKSSAHRGVSYPCFLHYLRCRLLDTSWPNWYLIVSLNLEEEIKECLKSGGWALFLRDHLWWRWISSRSDIIG